MLNVNLIFIVVAFICAVLAIYALYSIIMFKGTKKETELQLTTKNAYEQVKILYEKGEYALLELLASNYLARVPSHNDLRRYLAQAYFRNGKYNNAIKQCQIILKKDPRDTVIKKVLGDCYIRKNAYERAIRTYEELFDKNDRDPEIVRTLAELYRDTDQIFSAISVYNILSSIIDDKEQLASIYSILAELNENAHDYAAAFEAYKNRLEIYPTDIETNQKLIELYIMIKNNPKAIENLQYLLTITTDHKVLLWAYERLINLYVGMEEYEKAIDYSEKELEIQGSDKFKIRSDIASFYLKLNRIDNGIVLLEELVMITQNGYDVTIALAGAYLQKKEYQKALDKYIQLLDKATSTEAKEIRKLICELYIVWAIDSAENEQLEDSFKYLSSAEQYNPLNSEIYFNTAQNFMKKKNPSNAIENLTKAISYTEEKDLLVKYYLALAEAHHELGNFFEEKKALADLLKIDEKNSQGLFRTGLLYVALHDTKNAEESFKSALEYDPELIEAKYNLALIYETSNKDRARELFMEILSSDPTFEEAKQGLAELSSTDY